MKKILILGMAALLGLTCVGGLSATAAAEGTNETEKTAQVYLVPGSYYDEDGAKQQNTVENATALSEDECSALHMEGNVYKAGEKGSVLPKAQTENYGIVFNGWWYIVDAEIVYTDTVPAVTEDTYLYADFRADLSQHQDPVAPKGEVKQEYKHYLLITHTDGTSEKVQLYVSGTDYADMDDAGYGAPVQFFNEYFTLKKGDLIQVFITGIIEDDKPTNMPSNKKSGLTFANVAFETSGKSSTQSYISNYNAKDDGSGYADVENPTLKYLGNSSCNFRVYIKFSSQGARMNLYLEPKQ